MTQEKRNEFKTIIEEQILTLENEIEAIKASIYPNRGEGTSDKVAHLNFKQEQHLHFQRYEEALKRLNRLKRARLKVETPEYGICEECEEEIPLARLELIPESRYCIECMKELGK